MRLKCFSILLSSLLFGCSAVAANIVVIGDSLSCGSFGQTLYANLAKKNTVTLYCAVSSAPSHWLSGTNPTHQICQWISPANPALAPCGGDGKMLTLSSILSVNSDARVIIALGTNSLMSPQVTADYKTMADLVRAHGTCDWIGPPHLRADQSVGFPVGRVATEEANLAGFYDSLLSAVGTDCSFIDSRASTAPGTVGNETVDGVHRTADAGAYWANQIDGQLE